MTKWSLINCFLITIFIQACQPDEGRRYVPVAPPYAEMESEWVDSLIERMSIEEKIGQLLILKTELGRSDLEFLAYDWIESGKLGGVILNELAVSEFLNVVDDIKPLSNIPLFIGSEQKFLANGQFSDLPELPQSASFYAMADDSLKQKLKNLFVKQLLVLGINFNIGPVVDEFLPQDKISIKDYFEGDPSASPMEDIILPMRENGILSIGDHFSAGNLLYQEIDEETRPLLYPFQELKRLGISGYKIDPKLYEDPRLTRGKIRNFMMEVLDFEGLVVTEYQDENWLDEIVLSGADLIVIKGDPAPVFDLIKLKIIQQSIGIEEINAKVRRILLAKSWMHDGLDIEQELRRRLSRDNDNYRTMSAGNKKERPSKFQPFTKYAIYQHFTNENWKFLDRRVYEQGIVLVNNVEGILPFNKIYNRQFNLYEYAPTRLTELEEYLQNYAANVTTTYYPTFPNQSLVVPNLKQGVQIFAINQQQLSLKKDSAFIATIHQLASRREEVILINFGPDKNLRFFDDAISIIQVYEHNEMTESLVGQMLFGAVPAKGMLPFDVNPFYRAGAGGQINSFRLKYAQSEEVGISRAQLVSIDAIAKSAIDAGAMPGCQIVVAKDRKIIYSEAFGTHTYFGKPLRKSDLFDIASVTKVAATTLAIMKLYEDGAIRLSDRLKEHLELEDRSTLRNIRIRDLLTHSSGLQPNLPIGKYVLVRDSSRAKWRYFRPTQEPPFKIQIADSLFFNENYLDSIWLETQFLDLSRKRNYSYSDVNFVLLQKLVEAVTEQTLDEYVYENFYGPMGLKHTLFQPLTQYDTSAIVPTQLDDIWRMQLVHGFVHDETAALLGGVSGNAGVFSNAEDLAVIFQMLLNGGSYGGKSYLKPETIEVFTDDRHGNHRGLGFDKPYRNRRSTLARSASEKSFGHTGFTGTCAWVDPEQNLVYIFLSNRIHPDRNNYELVRLKVRERIHQVIFDALNSYQPNVPELDFELDMPDF